MPRTEPYTPTFDTGAQPQASPPEPSGRSRRWWRRTPDPSAVESPDPPVGPRTDLTADEAPPLEAIPVHGQADSSVATPPSEPAPAHAQSIVVPGRYCYLKWWQFVLMLVAVWIPAAAIGPGLFYWWTQDHSAHKAPVVFVTLIYVVVCIVAGLMLAMVPDRPWVSALAIAVMSAVFASVAAAAPFYGAFFCDHTVGPCLAGIIPY